MANEYEKALSHARAGRLETAQQILIGLEDERSEKLLAKVNKAIAARGTSATVAQVKPKKRSNPMVIVGGVLFILVLLVVVIGLGSVIYDNMQANQKALRLRAADLYCHGQFAVEAIRIEQEAFEQACEDTARDAASVQSVAIDYCLGQSQNGQLFQMLYDCMEEQNIYLSRQYIEAAK